MALCGKVDDAVDIVLLHDGAHAVEVADIGLHEGVVWLVFDILEIGKVACVGEGVKIDNFVLRVLVDEKTNDMRADESGASGNKNIVHTTLKVELIAAHMRFST